jgi:hypothetical protein
MREGIGNSLSEEEKGVLLGIVLDLSDSMRTSIQNSNRSQISRIESLSQAFRSAVEDGNVLLQSMVEEERAQTVRMFIYGFGFQSERSTAITSQIGDVFSMLTALETKVEHYKLLQPVLEGVWGGEVKQMLKQEQVQGDAKGELRDFVSQELKEQAIQAEQQRGLAKFQHWCASVCSHIDMYSSRLRTQAARYTKVAFIIIPLIIGFQWILRCPMLLMAFVNKVFSALLQRKLTKMRENADRSATKQADKVVALSQKALVGYHGQIFKVLHQAMLDFLDEEAFKIIHFYDCQKTVDVVGQHFDKAKLERVYKTVLAQIHAIMSPHADVSWERSIFLLKRAAKLLKIEPRWDILKEKTLICARQVVWEILEPEINDLVKTLAKERFTRAVLITIVEAERKRETTLSLTEIKSLFKMKSSLPISLNELPVFRASHIGMTLTWTFNRLWREARLPQNKGLRPVIVLISDGQPTDAGVVDLPILADKIKQLGIPIICCFITNRNVIRPWVLRNSPGLFWSDAARLMFNISSSVDEYPQLAEQLKDSRFVVQKQAKLFIQPNHSKYVHDFVKALLRPHQKEYGIK